MNTQRHIIRVILMAILAFFFLLFPDKIEANLPQSEINEAGPSGLPLSRTIIKDTFDNREERLASYLASHNSPMTPYASVFIQNADKYELDWRLVASIAGVESTFGKKIPANSYNAYGWNGGKYTFESWEDGIETVSKSLKEKYSDRWNAKTVWDIAPYYAPPSKTWAYNVNYFMEKIERGPKTIDITLELNLTI